MTIRFHCQVLYVERVKGEPLPHMAVLTSELKMERREHYEMIRKQPSVRVSGSYRMHLERMCFAHTTGLIEVCWMTDEQLSGWVIEYRNEWKCRQVKDLKTKASRVKLHISLESRASPQSVDTPTEIQIPLIYWKKHKIHKEESCVHLKSCNNVPLRKETFWWRGAGARTQGLGLELNPQPLKGNILKHTTDKL